MNQELDVWDSLLIRACKSNKISIRRFRKIWAMRCDLYYDYTDMADVIQHLIELIERLNLKSLSRFMEMFSKNLRWHDISPRKKDYSTEEAVFDTVIQVIRHTEVVKLPGYRSPTRFMKRRAES